jgi:hypothetical protein
MAKSLASLNEPDDCATSPPWRRSGKVVVHKTDDEKKLIELALHQNSLFTCLDEDQIAK